MAAQIGILLYPGAQISAVLGLTDLFHLAYRSAPSQQDGNGLRVRHLRADDGAEPQTIFDSAPKDPEDPRCDVLILPPSLEPPITARDAAPLAGWLRDRHAEGAVLASVCGGAFLLGETGLLGGRAVTTHWTYEEAFQDRFPEARLEADRLIIDGGDIISAGTS